MVEHSLWHPIRHPISDIRRVMPKTSPDVWREHPQFSEGKRMRNYFCSGFALFVLTQCLFLFLQDYFLLLLLAEVSLVCCYLYYLEFHTKDDEDVCPLGCVTVFALFTAVLVAAFTYNDHFVYYDYYLKGNSVTNATAAGGAGLLRAGAHLSFDTAVVDVERVTSFSDGSSPAYCVAPIVEPGVQDGGGRPFVLLSPDQQQQQQDHSFLEQEDRKSFLKENNGANYLQVDKQPFPHQIAIKYYAVGRGCCRDGNATAKVKSSFTCAQGYVGDSKTKSKTSEQGQLVPVRRPMNGVSGHGMVEPVFFHWNRIDVMENKLPLPDGYNSTQPKTRLRKTTSFLRETFSTSKSGGELSLFQSGESPSLLQSGELSDSDLLEERTSSRLTGRRSALESLGRVESLECGTGTGTSSSAINKFLCVVTDRNSIFYPIAALFLSKTGLRGYYPTRNAERQKWERARRMAETKWNLTTADVDEMVVYVHWVDDPMFWAYTHLAYSVVYLLAASCIVFPPFMLLLAWQLAKLATQDAFEERAEEMAQGEAAFSDDDDDDLSGGTEYSGKDSGSDRRSKNFWEDDSWEDDYDALSGRTQ
ncbi:unnamed protein product [Amoebophrya sp. A25]|nr:unnamed protein product [Amoebophrya sp. A25]|eukprot:GSA25T00018245001.1